MAEKLTPKQEAFCRKYIETGNASEAYRQSYDAKGMKPETIHVKASQLLADGKVRIRVEEIQERHLRRHNVTVDSLVEELQEARELARNISRPEVMINATLGKAKITGLTTDAPTNTIVIHLAEDDESLLDEYAKRD